MCYETSQSKSHWDLRQFWELFFAYNAFEKKLMNHFHDTKKPLKVKLIEIRYSRDKPFAYNAFENKNNE